MLKPKPEDFLLLLNVFYLGLTQGVITKEEVVAWSDGIIIKEEEPDYFFIELSLCSSTNALIETLNQYVGMSDNPICIRVVLSYVYRKLINDNNVLTLEQAAELVGSLQNYDGLTDFEVGRIYDFEEYNIYYQPELTHLKADIIDFLSIYKDFTINNFEQWEDINSQVLDVLIKEKQKADIAHAIFMKSYKNGQRKDRLKLYLRKSMAIIVISGSLILFIYLFPDVIKLSPICFIIVGYFLIKAGIQLVEPKKR